MITPAWIFLPVLGAAALFALPEGAVRPTPVDCVIAPEHETRIATSSSKLTERRIVETAPVTCAPNAHRRRATIRPATISGRVPNHAPGHGAAWIVEAYRLTSARSSIVEQRRVYLSPHGEFELRNLTPGAWQLAIVAPTFAWGPIVELGDTTQLRTDVSFGAPRHGLGDLVDAALGPIGTEVRIDLFAVRSPEPASPHFRLQHRVRRVVAKVGDHFAFTDLAPGDYEVVLTSSGTAATVLRSDLRVGGSHSTRIQGRPAKPLAANRR